MKPEVGRRVFVGSMVAGLPLVAGWKAGASAQGAPIVAASPGARVAADPILEYITRQIAAIHNAALAAPRGEQARALASQLRMLAVYARQARLDEEIQRTAADIVARQGRNVLLFAEIDSRRHQADRERFGFRSDPRLADYPVEPTFLMREAAVETLLHRGITPTFERLAALAESIARPLDRSRAGFVAVQDDAEWWQGYCDELWSQFQDAQLLAVPFCYTAKFLEWATPACLALEGGAAFLLLVYLTQCLLFR